MRSRRWLALGVLLGLLGAWAPKVRADDPNLVRIFHPLPRAHYTYARVNDLRGRARMVPDEHLEWAFVDAQQVERVTRLKRFGMILDVPHATPRKFEFALGCNCAQRALAWVSAVHPDGTFAILSITWQGPIEHVERYAVNAVVFSRGYFLEYMITTSPYMKDRLYLVRSAAFAPHKGTMEAAKRPGRPRHPMLGGRRGLDNWRRDWSDDGSRIDLIVGYTTDVLTDAGDELSIRSRTVTAVCGFNNALERSKVDTKVCVVDFVALDMYEDLDSSGAASSDLDLLAAVQLDMDLRKARYDAKADVATVLVARDRQSDWGQAEIWNPADGYFAEKAYSITSWLQLQGGFALAHEVAHNFGCQHIEDDGDPLKAFAHAYTFTVTRSETYYYGTKTWEETHCTVVTQADDDTGCKEWEPVFSTPEGTSPEDDPSGVAVGDAATADNSRVIRKRLRVIANWGNNLTPVP